MASQQKCILCNSSSVFQLTFTKTYKKLGQRSYLRCRECDLIFVPEEFHLSPDDEEARYRLHHNSLSNEGYVKMFREKIFFQAEDGIGDDLVTGVQTCV